MHKIGLTGGIGAGKSSIAKWFTKIGVPVFDADKFVHSIFQKKEFAELIAREFGQQYEDNYKVNRRLLGEMIFNNDKAKIRLESLIHPLVLKRMLEFCTEMEAKGHKYVVLDVPLLFEAGWEKYCDETWVVYLPEEIQLERIILRDKVSMEEAKKKIDAQMPMAEKLKKASRIIDNTSEWQTTKKSLETIWEGYLSN